MSTALRLTSARLRRSLSQTATQVAVLAAAVALLGSMLLFIGHALQTMTASATRSVPVDLQGPVRSLPRGAHPGELASPDVLTWEAPLPPRPRPSRGSSIAVPKA